MVSKLNAFVSHRLAFFSAWVLCSTLPARADDHDDDLDVFDNRTPEQVAALRDNIDEVIETAAFYSAFGALLALLAFGAFVQRRFAWSAYAMLTLLALTWNAFFEQNLGGLYWLGIALTPDQVVAAGFLFAILSAAVAGYLAPPRLRVPIFGSAAGIALLWLVHTRLDDPAAAILFAVVLVGAALLHFLPISKMRGFVGGLRGRWYVTAVGAALLVWTGTIIAELDEEIDPIFLNRAIASLLTTMFIVLFLIRTAQALRDRDAAVRKSLADAKKEAETSRALYETEKRYSDARALAQDRSRRLASASHDIRQPIAALRTTMAAVMQQETKGVRDQMNAAFDYLGQLADEFVEEGRQGAKGGIARDERLPPTDYLSTGLLAATIDRMFRQEAQTKGLRFSIDLEDSDLIADPLKLMRAVSNLTANAIHHTASGSVTITGQDRPDHFALTITNTAAMAGTVPDLSEPFAKGATSTGTGLGLSIVRDLAAEGAFDLDIDTSVAGQTTIHLLIPPPRGTPPAP